MDFYEALTGNGQDTSNPVATLGAALSAPPPSVQMPERPKPDTEMLPALAMLHLAASLAQRRQIGQSRLSQALSSAADTGSYAMNFKAQAEDRAAKRYSEDLAAANLKSTMTGQAIQQQGQQQQNVMQAAKAPYEIANLQEAIKSARDETKLKDFQVRMAKVKDTYAERMAQAELDIANSKSQDEKSAAENRYTMAKAAVDTAAAHMASAKAQGDKVALEKQIWEDGKSKGDFKIIQGLPGEQSNFTYIDAKGNVQTGKMPLDDAVAAKKAEADWKAMKNFLPDGTDEQRWKREHIQQLINPPSYQKALADQVARTRGATPDAANAATPPGTPSAGKPSTAGQVPQSAAIPDYVLQQSKNMPTEAVKWTGKDANGALVVKYLIGGKEVDAATAEGRRVKGSTNTGQGAAPATTPAATPSATPAQSPQLTGAYASERGDLQRAIDEAQTAVTSASTMQERIEASNKIRILNNALLRLEDMAKK